MSRYDWCNKDYIESKPCTYVIFNKLSGRPVYNGKADDAKLRLAQNAHPYYIEGTYAVIAYYHGNASTRALLDIEAEQITNARLPRKNTQGNQNNVRLCKHLYCGRRVIYPQRYCWQHSNE